MTNPDRYPWAAFLGGTWQKTKPGRPGTYFIADRSGVVRGTHRLITTRTGDVVSTTAPWLGWWWSMPMPDAPTRPVPEWGE